MSDRMWAKIEIGGTISRRVLTDLVAFGVEVPLLEELASPETVRHLGMEDGEAPWGVFEELETYLVEQAVPFDRVSDGKYEHSPEVRRFRPSISPSISDERDMSQAEADRTFLCDHHNRPMVAVADIDKALAKTQTRAELAARLIALCGLDIPELPPLSIAEA